MKLGSLSKALGLQDPNRCGNQQYLRRLTMMMTGECWAQSLILVYGLWQSLWLFQLSLQLVVLLLPTASQGLGALGSETGCSDRHFASLPGNSICTRGIEIHWASLAIKEMQIKTTKYYFVCLAKILLLKCYYPVSVGEISDLKSCRWEYKLLHFVKMIWWKSIKSINNMHVFWLSNSTSRNNV